MKKPLLIGAAFAVLLAPAMAAEKPVRVHKRVRPVVVAAPVYNWTGFYAGVHAGWGWNDSTGTSTISAGGIPTVLTAQHDLGANGPSATSATTGRSIRDL
jgi:outer membrane immunogenic protein